MPCPISREPPLERVKVGALMLSKTVAFWVILPEVPVMVSVLVPTAAELLAVRVSVLALVAGFGENAAVTPEGRPETERLTLPLNPYSGKIST